MTFGYHVDGLESCRKDDSDTGKQGHVSNSSHQAAIHVSTEFILIEKASRSVELASVTSLHIGLTFGDIIVTGLITYHFAH